jgi:multimeric flavodoxin WrbA
LLLIARTPVNWYYTSSPLKLMIDRLVCADGGNPDPTATHGKDARQAKAIELSGWDYPKHLGKDVEPAPGQSVELERDIGLNDAGSRISRHHSPQKLLAWLVGHRSAFDEVTPLKARKFGLTQSIIPHCSSSRASGVLGSAKPAVMRYSVGGSFSDER